MQSRWLRALAWCTVAATAGLLTLGALVTSFRVGMADPVWPTEPWRLAFIDWSEPSRGYLIEHSHRLGGFIVGGLMSLLAIGLWMTEPRRDVRWGGVAALVGLLLAYGWLHGVLIRQTRELTPGSPLTLPPAVAGVLVLALGGVMIAAIVAALTRSPGWGLRLLAIALLVGVMIQGLLGGLRVHLNALFGEGLAIFHAAFAQIVFALVVVIACLTEGRNARISLAWLATILLYLQIVFGAILRHTQSLLAARLHLLMAFAAGFAVIVGARRSENRLWRNIALHLLALQILLGVEAWMTRYAGGLLGAELNRITTADALLRTAHAVTGYLLFAATIRLSFSARRPLPSAIFQSRVLEGVA